MNGEFLQLFMETSCGVVLVNFGSILLLQYPQGHWDFPKGHVEEGDDSFIATARRELSEETGITDLKFIDGFGIELRIISATRGKKLRNRFFGSLLKLKH